MPPATAGPSAEQARQHLLDLLGPLVTEAGFDLEDVTVTTAGRRSLVRVVVDADGGIDLDAVATASRVVAEALDAEYGEDETGDGSLLSGAYVLEVSSPGVDRPLTEPRHWRRAAGRVVTTRSGGRTLTGRVVSTDDSGATLDIQGARRTIAWADLGRGKVQVEFNRSDGSPDAGSPDVESSDVDSSEEE